MKPVGIRDPRTGARPYAVVQLRQEDKRGVLYNLVGFQTKLRVGEQQRILRTLPGLSGGGLRALRLGASQHLHQRSAVSAARRSSCAQRPGCQLAGQIAGVEGYVESAALGGAGRASSPRIAARGEAPPRPDAATAHGALLHHLANADPRHFQPMNVNFGLFPPLAERRAAAAQAREARALAARALDGVSSRVARCARAAGARAHERGRGAARLRASSCAPSATSRRTRGAPIAPTCASSRRTSARRVVAGEITSVDVRGFLASLHGRARPRHARSQARRAAHASSASLVREGVCALDPTAGHAGAAACRSACRGRCAVDDCMALSMAVAGRGRAPRCERGCATARCVELLYGAGLRVARAGQRSTCATSTSTAATCASRQGRQASAWCRCPPRRARRSRPSWMRGAARACAREPLFTALRAAPRRRARLGRARRAAHRRARARAAAGIAEPRAPASAAPQLCDAPARHGRRPARDPGAARPREPLDHREVHGGLRRAPGGGLRSRAPARASARERARRSDDRTTDPARRPCSPCSAADAIAMAGGRPGHARQHRREGDGAQKVRRSAKAAR